MSQIAHVGESLINNNASISGVMGHGMMGFGGNHTMGSFGVWMGLTWLLLISFLISGIYFFIKQTNKK